MRYLTEETVQAVHAKIKETESKLDLRVNWIRTADELTETMNRGLIQLYQRVFADEPYNELFSDDEVRDIFSTTLDVDGFVFTASSADQNIPVAFVASTPMIMEPAVGNIIKSHFDPKKSSYFSEDATAQEWRRRGISTAMKDLLLTANFTVGFEHVILRTSAYNYSQISAVGKAGGEVVLGLYQDVESTRSDGTTSSDKRSFYVFNKDLLSRPAQPWFLNRVTVARPGGNDTAIVWDHVDRTRQGPVSLLIQDAFPGVEQVMFVENPCGNSLPRGQMAGGEFCGNATRSLGYLHLKGEDGEIDLEISGTAKPLRIEVKGGFSKTEIPILDELDCVKTFNPHGEYIAHLEGISFLITYESLKHGLELASLRTVEERKSRVLEILKTTKLSEKVASGILVLKQEDSGDLRLDPYVYVRDTNTLYYESGCGSGSTAVGLMLSKKLGISIQDQKIIQPSGMGLYVSVERSAKKFLRASVNGPVNILFDGKMYLYSRLSQHNKRPETQNGYSALQRVVKKQIPHL